jgi:hypothetical protein
MDSALQWEFVHIPGRTSSSHIWESSLRLAGFIDYQVQSFAWGWEFMVMVMDRVDAPRRFGGYVSTLLDNWYEMNITIHQCLSHFFLIIPGFANPIRLHICSYRCIEL